MNIEKDLIDAFNNGYQQAAAEVAHLKQELHSCKNELCLRCGQYKSRHLGACDGCRWRDV